MHQTSSLRGKSSCGKLSWSLPSPVLSTNPERPVNRLSHEPDAVASGFPRLSASRGFPRGETGSLRPATRFPGPAAQRRRARATIGFARNARQDFGRVQAIISLFSRIVDVERFSEVVLPRLREEELRELHHRLGILNVLNPVRVSTGGGMRRVPRPRRVYAGRRPQRGWKPA